jgi:LPXTG-motif cell wall-anchored protein
MRKKLSFLSGLAAAALFVFPFASNTYAAETNSLVSTEGTVSEVVYEVPNDVYVDIPEDVYVDVPEDVYEDVPEEVYADVPEEVYADVPEEVYEEVPVDVNEDVYQDVYQDVYDDVYQDVYEDVYQDVYEDHQFLYLDIANENGDIELNYSNPNSNLIVLEVAQGDYDDLLAKNPNAKVIINKDNLHVAIPLKKLPVGLSVLRIIEDSKNYEGAVSSVYDFTIQISESTFQTDFSDNPVVLTFKVSNVKDWNNLKVKFIDSKGQISNEEVKILSINKETGEVVAEVTHFSSYGVFEITPTSTDNTNNNGGTTGNTNNNSGTTGNTSNNGGTTGNTSNNGGTTGTTNVNTNTNTNTNGTGTQTNTTNGTTSTTGNALPDTATNSFNLLLAGLMLLTAGGAFVIRNRKVSNS